MQDEQVDEIQKKLEQREELLLEVKDPLQEEIQLVKWIAIGVSAGIMFAILVLMFVMICVRTCEKNKTIKMVQDVNKLAYDTDDPTVINQSVVTTDQN